MMFCAGPGHPPSAAVRIITSSAITPYFNVTFPAILGHEGIGEVIAVGPNVRHFAIGDIVTRIRNKLPSGSRYSLMYGAFAEKSIATDWQAMRDDNIPEDRWQPYTIHRRLPHGMDIVGATMLITWRETYAFLHGMGLCDDQKVLVIGSGATALSVANHLRNLGLHIAVIGSATRFNALRRMGVTVTVPYQDTDCRKRLAEAEMNRFDGIIDTISSGNTLNTVGELLVNGGKIGIYGLDRFQDYRIDFRRYPDRVTFYNGTTYDEGAAHQMVMSFIRKGMLDPWDYLSRDHIYPLERIHDALHACESRKALKSVITFD